MPTWAGGDDDNDDDGEDDADADADLGRPKALLYKWSLGDHIVNHVTTETWTINPVTLETQVIQLLYIRLDLRSSSLASLYH